MTSIASQGAGRPKRIRLKAAAFEWVAYILWTDLDLRRLVLRRARDAHVRNPAHADLQRDDAVPLRVRRAVGGDVRHDRRGAARVHAAASLYDGAAAILAGGGVARVSDRDDPELPDPAQRALPRLSLDRRDLRDRLH